MHLWQTEIVYFEWRQLVRKCDRDHEEHIIDSNHTGSFFKYITGQFGRRSSIGVIQDADKIIDTDKEKANVLNSNFSSVGVADNGLLLWSLKIIVTKKWKT
jgi:hypothetical protein